MNICSYRETREQKVPKDLSQMIHDVMEKRNKGRPQNIKCVNTTFFIFLFCVSLNIFPLKFNASTAQQDLIAPEFSLKDLNGKLIKSVELTQRGNGALTVFAENLSDGLYTYTLVVDGKIFATKKMEKN